MSDSPGASPVVYQPRKSWSLNTCRTETGNIAIYKCILIKLEFADTSLEMYEMIVKNYFLDEIIALQFTFK